MATAIEAKISIPVAKRILKEAGLHQIQGMIFADEKGNCRAIVRTHASQVGEIDTITSEKPILTTTTNGIPLTKTIKPESEIPINTSYEDGPHP